MNTEARELTIHELLRNQHVKRWHIVHTDRVQTVADHLWAVTVLGWELHHRMHSIVPWESYTRLLVLHDSTESITGDWPTPAKRHLTDPGTLGYEFSKEYAALDQWAGSWLEGLPAAMLKCVDLIEAVRFMWMHVHGAHARSVALLLESALIKHTQHCMERWPSENWDAVAQLFNESIRGPEPGSFYDGHPIFVVPKPEPAPALDKVPG